MPELGFPGYIEGQDGEIYAYFPGDFTSEDIAAGLGVWASVEFDPDMGEVNRALSCTLVHREEAPTGEEGESEIIDTYSEPPAPPMLCRDSLAPKWEPLVVSNWIVRGSSTVGPDEARRELKQRARALKANAVLDVDYSRQPTATTTVFLHHYQGRLAIIARRDREGMLKRESFLVDLDKEAEQEVWRLEQQRTAAVQGNARLYGICLGAVVLTGLVAGFLSLLMLAVCLIAATVAATLTENTRPAAQLVRNPLPPPDAAHESRLGLGSHGASPIHNLPSGRTTPT